MLRGRGRGARSGFATTSEVTVVARSLETSHPDVVIEAAPENFDPGAANRRTIYLVVCLALLMASIDQTIVATALPRIEGSLHTQLNWAAWTLTAFQLGALTAAPTFGKLSQIYGRKKVFLSCVALFTVASLFCGLAQNIGELIALRAVQSIGGGAFIPVATGIVSDAFGKDRDRAIGFFTSILPIGALIGPVLGGVITAEWSWRGIFFINVPIGIVLLITGLKHLPASGEKTGERPDLIGVGLLATTLLSTMYAVTTLGSKSVTFGSPQFLAPLVGGVVLGVFLVRRMRQVEHPIIPVHLLRHRIFATMNVIVLVYGGCFLGFGALVPIYARERYHIDILQSGTILIGRGIGAIAVAGITSVLMRKIGYRIPMVVGFIVAAFGLVLLAVSPIHLGVYAWLSIGSVFVGLGTGISAPATNNATLSYSPNEVSQIAGLRSMFRQAGGILAISITTAVVVRQQHEGIALGRAFVFFAGIIVFIAIPLTFMVPSRKGNW